MEPFALPYFREAAAEILLLAIPCGLIGSWIVLRGLAFHSHAVGTATFPGLVLAEGLGFAVLPGAIAAALAFTAFSVLVGRSRQTGADAMTALALTGCLAAGVILASDVFGSGPGVDTLLFGSLLSIGPGDLRLAAAAMVLAAASAFIWGPRWLARGFDPDFATSLSPGFPRLDGFLLVIVAIVVVSALGAAGALLASALVVVPAATVRLYANRVRSLELGSIALVAIQGMGGLWFAAKTDVPPGAAIAVISGAVFLLAAGTRKIVRQRRGLSRILVPAATALALGTAVGVGAGCTADRPAGSGPAVVATTTQIGDLVRQVGDGRIRLTTILNPGSDPHSYEPRPSDVEALAEADLIFRSGGPVDTWMTGLIADAGSNARVIDLGERLPAPLTEDGETDPHWWQDPVNLAAAAVNAGNILALQSPAEASRYRAGARRFGRAARRLTEDIHRCVAKIPPGERKIVTDHDAFAYLTSRFGIETVGTVLPALSSRAAPSAQDLARLEETIGRESIRAVFPEKSANPALAEALAKDTGTTIGNLLYGDALGPAGSPGATLLGSIRSNADALVRGMSSGRISCEKGSDA